MKKCSKCDEFLDESCFGPASGGTYLRSECKQCNNSLGKERKLLRKKYGQPKDDYRCPICLRNKDELLGIGGRAGVWVVDHDHITGAFRGWLCHQCNRGIGAFKDNTYYLERAIKYLKN